MNPEDQHATGQAGYAHVLGRRDASQYTAAATATVGETTIIDRGFLMALRDPAVIEMAARYGDPVDLLEGEI